MNASTTSTHRVGLIGVGNMGWQIGVNLLRHGFAVEVLDAIPERAAQFVEQVGGALLDEHNAPALITMLPTSREVTAVLDPLVGSIPAGTLIIEMSSGSPDVTRRLAERFARTGVAMIDAPVSGGVPRAVTGELAIMVGGAEVDIVRAEPILSAVGTSILRCGPLGAGQAMKSLNNLVSAGGFLIGAEALLIGQRFGLDPARMVEVLNESSGMNNATQKKFAQYVLSRSFDSGFGLDLMAKDVGIALGLGADSNTPTPFASLLVELIRSAQRVLGPGNDQTDLARFCELLAGTELTPGSSA